MNTKSILFVILSLWSVATVSAQNTLPRVKNLYADSLTVALDAVSQKSLIPGFVVATANEHKITYIKGFGLADKRRNIAFTPLTVNWIASISKTFVALSVMKLVEQKKLDLDEPINSILPYTITNPYFPDKPITIRHLVTHTSSIIDDDLVAFNSGQADQYLEDDNKKYDSLPAYFQPNVQYYRMGKKISLDEFVKYYTVKGQKWYNDSTTFSKKEPGTFFQYSNLGANIVARIVEVKSGMSFRDFTKKYIFKPLKMANTAWSHKEIKPTLLTKWYIPDDDKAPKGVLEAPRYSVAGFANGGLYTNISDLSRYLIEMIKGSNGKGTLLSKQAYTILFQAQRPSSNELHEKDQIGIFWFVSSTGVLSHLGGSDGVYSFLYFNPATKSGAIGFSNMRNDDFGHVHSAVKKYEPHINKQMK